MNSQKHLRLVRALELDGATTDYPDIKRTGRFIRVSTPARRGQAAHTSGLTSSSN
ncbi:hypothetical protein SGLAM104S_00996 [Streptomyces glaucescens]